MSSLILTGRYCVIAAVMSLAYSSSAGAQTWAERAAVIDAVSTSNTSSTSHLVILEPAAGAIRNFEVRESGALRVVFDFERASISFIRVTRAGNSFSTLNLSADRLEQRTFSVSANGKMLTMSQLGQLPELYRVRQPLANSAPGLIDSTPKTSENFVPGSPLGAALLALSDSIARQREEAAAAAAAKLADERIALMRAELEQRLVSRDSPDHTLTEIRTQRAYYADLLKDRFDAVIQTLERRVEASRAIHSAIALLNAGRAAVLEPACAEHSETRVLRFWVGVTGEHPLTRKLNDLLKARIPNSQSPVPGLENYQLALRDDAQLCGYGIHLISPSAAGSADGQEAAIGVVLTETGLSKDLDGGLPHLIGTRVYVVTHENADLIASFILQRDFPQAMEASITRLVGQR